MWAIIEVLGWIADIIGLDLKVMSPAARVFVIVVYGLFGLVFLGAGFIPLLERDADGWRIAGGLTVSALGFALLARIVYGLIEIRRLNRGPT
jgi:hypothetical protein